MKTQNPRPSHTITTSADCGLSKPKLRKEITEMIEPTKEIGVQGVCSYKTSSPKLRQWSMNWRCLRTWS